MLIIDEIVSASFGAALFVNACLFVPQIIRLLVKKDAEGVSIITFLGFDIINLISLAYGFEKQDWIMIFGYGTSALANTLVVVLAFYYRASKKHLP